jgi:hypothetical protein
VNNDNFREEIISKPYPKYVYEIAKKGPKTAEKEAFLKAINRFSSNHLYGENLLKKRGHCFFYPQKDVLKHQKEQKSADFYFKKSFQLNSEDLIEIEKREEPKRRQIRLKRIK